jgi:hypothetical protein
VPKAGAVRKKLGLTLVSAPSMLRLRSNWTTMVAKPSAEVEVSEVMPEIVESCRSIGPACCALHYVREKRPLRSTPHSAACI